MHVLVKFGTDACMLARIGRLQIALPETLYIVVPLKVAMTRLILTVRIRLHHPRYGNIKGSSVTCGNHQRVPFCG